MTFELADLFCEFFDLNELIIGNIRKMLTCVCCRPPHIDRDNVRIMSQADVLFHRIGAEGTIFSDCSIDRPRLLTIICHRDLYLRADS